MAAENPPKKRKKTGNAALDECEAVIRQSKAVANRAKKNKNNTPKSVEKEHQLRMAKILGSSDIKSTMTDDEAAQSLLGFLEPSAVGRVYSELDWNGRRRASLLVDIATNMEDKRSALMAIRMLDETTMRSLLASGMINKIVERFTKTDDSGAKMEATRETHKIEGIGSHVAKMLEHPDVSVIDIEIKETNNAQNPDSKRQLPSPSINQDQRLDGTSTSDGRSGSSEAEADSQDGQPSSTGSSRSGALRYGLNGPRARTGSSQSNPDNEQSGSNGGSSDSDSVADQISSTARTESEEPPNVHPGHGRKPPVKQVYGGGICDRGKPIPGDDYGEDYSDNPFDDAAL